MVIVTNILIVLEVLASIALIVAVLLQEGKDAGMGAISGSSESYMSKGDGRGLNAIMASATKWIATAWLVLTLALSIL